MKEENQNIIYMRKLIKKISYFLFHKKKTIFITKKNHQNNWIQNSILKKFHPKICSWNFFFYKPMYLNSFQIIVYQKHFYRKIFSSINTFKIFLSNNSSFLETFAFDSDFVSHNIRSCQVLPIIF